MPPLTRGALKARLSEAPAAQVCRPPSIMRIPQLPPDATVEERANEWRRLAAEDHQEGSFDSALAKVHMAGIGYLLADETPTCLPFRQASRMFEYCALEWNRKRATVNRACAYFFLAMLCRIAEPRSYAACTADSDPAGGYRSSEGRAENAARLAAALRSYIDMCPKFGESTYAAWAEMFINFIAANRASTAEEDAEWTETFIDSVPHISSVCGEDAVSALARSMSRVFKET